MLLLINLLLFSTVIIALRKYKAEKHWRKILKHIGILELAWAGFSILLGLFFLFDVFESLHNDQSFWANTTEHTVEISLLFSAGLLHLGLCGVVIFKMMPERNTQ